MRCAILSLLSILVLSLSLSTSALAQADGAPASPAAKTAPTADQPAEPTDVKEAAGTLKDAVAAARAGKWWHFSALVILLLMFALKFIGKKVGFWPKLGRWRYVIVPVLSLAAALLAAFQGGLSFEAAMGVFGTAYASSSLQELWEHGILGKERATA